MELSHPSAATEPMALAALFSDLVRLETELWDRIDDRLRRDHDMPLTWFEPLQVIERTRNCRVADIAGVLSITEGGTSKLVDRIERTGWCRRSPNPGDGRSSVIVLTPTGRRRLGAARGSFEAELEACLGAALPFERLDALASAVRTVRAHIAGRRGTT